MFNSLTVTAVSGTGGTGGTDGDCANGGDGGAGNPSSLADYVATGSGPGGTRSGNAGSSNTASTTITITDANQASVLARYGVSKAATIGGGGGGGGTGLYTNYYFQCDLLGFLYGVPYCQIGHNYGSCNGHAGGGAAGADGYIVIAWT